MVYSMYITEEFSSEIIRLVGCWMILWSRTHDLPFTSLTLIQLRYVPPTHSMYTVTYSKLIIKFEEDVCF